MKAFEFADTIESWVETCYSYAKILELSGEMQAVILEMRSECPSDNWAMFLALDNCSLIVEQGIDGLQKVMSVSGVAAVGDFAIEWMCETLWGCVTEAVETAFPVVKIVTLIYKGGKLLANELFNADATAEAYYKLLALNNFQDLGRLVMDDYAADFKRIGTEDVAKIYLESVKLCWQIHMNGTQYTIDFYSAMHEGAMSGVEEWIADASYEEIIADFKAVKSMTELSKAQFDTAWIAWLSEDYPEIYPAYEYRLYEILELEKKIGIACPVDVRVYDENDVLVAYVKDGRPYASGNISAVVVGEDKYFYFYDDEQYKVVCDGYANGTMDVFVTEYDNDVVSRKINYLDVPVSSGSIHDLDGSTYKLSDRITQIKPDYDTSRAETKYTVRINNGFATTDNTFEYEFEAEAGQIIDINTHLPAGYRFEGWTCDNSAVEFDDPMSMGTSFVMVDENIVINATMSAASYSVIVAAGTGGSVSGGGTVSAGAETTVTATPNTGYRFVHWTENGKVVSTDARYTFTVTSNRSLTAVFERTATNRPASPVILPGGSANSNHFVDVDVDDWFYDDVMYVHDLGLMGSTGNRRFAPDAVTSRAMIVTILHRLEGEPIVASGKKFKDVEENTWYSSAVAWAAANKIVDGYGGKQFGPNDPITREQLAAILYRYAEYKGLDNSVSADITSYKDADQVSSYAISAMKWACGEYLFNGSNGNLQPKGNALRCQVAAIFHRFCENIYY